jgi:hypothetical protein
LFTNIWIIQNIRGLIYFLYIPLRRGTVII